MAGMTVLLLLLWAGVAVSSPADLQKRVVGGKMCDKAERKYHVYVEGKNKTHSSMCGGSLISEHWVLTAAHCWESKMTMTAILSVHPGQLDRTKGRVGIKDHKIYNDGVRSHDLMLLELDTPSSITPIQLLTDDECKKQDQITQIEVAGYAATTLGGNDEPSTLQCGKIGLLSAQQCTNRKNAMKNCRNPEVQSLGHQNFFCYLSSTVAIQEGDSGGGAVHNGKLYGVIVWGPDDKDACVKPSYAMDLCNKDYRDWIKNAIKKPKSCLWCG